MATTTNAFNIYQNDANDCTNARNRQNAISKQCSNNLTIEKPKQKKVILISNGWWNNNKHNERNKKKSIHRTHILVHFVISGQSLSIKHFAIDYFFMNARTIKNLASVASATATVAVNCCFRSVLSQFRSFQMAPLNCSDSVWFFLCICNCVDVRSHTQHDASMEF